MSQAAAVPSQARLLSLLRRRSIHELGLLLLLTMEVSWFIPWFRSLTAATLALTSLQVLALFLGVSVVTMAAARALRAGEARPAIRQGALLALLLVGFIAGLRLVVFRDSPTGLVGLVVHSLTSFAEVLTVVPGELIVVLSLLYVWRRGVAASVVDVLDPGLTAYKFRLGIMSLVIYALVHRAELGTLMLEILPWYFGTGLAAIALGRADSLARARGAGRSPFTGQWLVSMLLLAAATTGLGVLAGSWLGGPTAIFLFDRLSAVLYRLLGLVVLVIGPLILGVAWLAERILGLLHVPEGLASVFDALRRILPRTPFEPAAERESFFSWLEPYLPWVKIVATSLVIAVLALAAIRGARRARRSLAEPDEDAGDTLLTANAILAGLRQMLARMGDGWGNRRLGSARRLLAATVIRRIYGRLLSLAEEQGRARYPAETPLEYLGYLKKLFPNRGSEVSTITNAYVQVRYGELPEAEAMVAVVRECWSVLRADARQARPASQN